MTNLPNTESRRKRQRRCRVDHADQRIVDRVERALRICRERRLDEAIDELAETYARETDCWTRSILTPRAWAILRDEFHAQEGVLVELLVPRYESIGAGRIPYRGAIAPTATLVNRIRRRLRRVHREFRSPIRELVEITGLGERTVKRHLARLREMGVIEKRPLWRTRRRIVVQPDGPWLAERRERAENLYRIVGGRRKGQLYALAERYEAYAYDRKPWGGAHGNGVPQSRADIEVSDIAAARMVRDDRERQLAKTVRAKEARRRRETHSDYVLIEPIPLDPASHTSKMAPHNTSTKVLDSFSSLEEKRKNGAPAARCFLSSEPVEVEPEPASCSNSTARLASKNRAGSPSSTAAVPRWATLLDEHNVTPPGDRGRRAVDVLAAQAAFTRAQDERDRMEYRAQLAQLDREADALRAAVRHAPEDAALQERLDALDMVRGLLRAEYAALWEEGA